MTLEGTAWVGRTLKEAWPRIAAKVPHDWLPRREAPGSPAELDRYGNPRKFVLEEYGCGHYGCVMPTGTEALVCKLTSDVTEARFIAMTQTFRQPRGIVEYRKILHIEDVTHRNRPLFILWREEANDVGILNGLFRYGGANDALKKHYDDHAIRELQKNTRLLDAFRKEAIVAQKYIQPRLQTLERSGFPRNVIDADRQIFLKTVWSAYENSSYQMIEVPNGPRSREEFGAPKSIKGMQRVGIAISNCHAIGQELENSPNINNVGTALRDYIEEGILLADVHLGNIGMSLDNELIITDPGHAVQIHPRWVSTPEIESV